MTRRRIVPTINLNGESRDVHILQRMHLAAKIGEVVEMMGALKPHGRDYPGREDDLEADRSEHSARVGALMAVASVLFSEAVTLKKETNQ